MRLTWQNLNDGGSGWREGRCWLWSRNGGDALLRFEWAHPGHELFALKVTTYGHLREWSLHLALPFGSWWLGRGGQDSWGRASGVTLWQDWLRVFWNQQQPNDEGGWAWSVHLLDILLGKTQYREGAPTVHRIEVAMPERLYVGTCALHADSWKRPRWFRRTIRRATIDMDKGQQVPVPGKGENSYDCGEDAVFGITLPAATPDEAVAGLIASVLRSRARHGGPRWRPALPVPATVGG